jgi:hypothetical protein
MCVFESVGFCRSSGPDACALRAQPKTAAIKNRWARDFFIKHQPTMEFLSTR